MTDFAERYYKQGEDWATLSWRVSGVTGARYGKIRDVIFDMIRHKLFIPSSPILMHAGNPRMSMMACHLLDIYDSTNDIFDALRVAANITKFGGGTGLNFSQLSPSGAALNYTSMGGASGPVSFMAIFDMMAKVMMQGGWRRAALMGILAAEHPDIMEFITAKQQDGVLSNFNISVSLEHGPDSIPPNVWHAICDHAYNNGEPGLLFLDNINADNPLLRPLGPITGTNPCSEMPIYANESCCLASVVLPNVIHELGNYVLLRDVVSKMVIFLDGVIDASAYADREIEEKTKWMRRIGIGVMGLETLFDREGIAFGSDEANAISSEIAEQMRTAAYEMSARMVDRSWPRHMAYTRRRHVSCITIAPTGHISRVAGVSPSIYPSYHRQLSMTPEQHIAHVLAWQQHVDNAVSYTVCFPEDAKPGIVNYTYRLAYERGIKCMSVYRDMSRANQPNKCADSDTCTL